MWKENDQIANPHRIYPGDRIRLFQRKDVEIWVEPELEKEINEGRHFAPMRQVYLSVILATWFKRNLKKFIRQEIFSK